MINKKRLYPNNIAYAIVLFCIFALKIDSPLATAVYAAGEYQVFNRIGDIDSKYSVSLQDTIPPTVLSIVLAGPSTTNQNSVDFIVTFSEPVVGVDMVGPDFDDFVLTTSPGITGAHITNVSGSGAVYTVTVNTGTGDGTIRLEYRILLRI